MVRKRCGQRSEVECPDPAACPVTKPQHRAWFIGFIHDQPAGADRSWHRDIHDPDATRSGREDGCWLKCHGEILAPPVR
jgi:hypothetical protein